MTAVFCCASKGKQMTQTKDVFTKRMAQKAHSHLEAVPDTMEEVLAKDMKAVKEKAASLMPDPPKPLNRMNKAEIKPKAKKKPSGKSKKKN